MAIRNAKLGGTDFADGEVLYDYDLDDTYSKIIDSIGNLQSESNYKLLESSGIFNNSGLTAVEQYTIEDGVNGTVNIISNTAVFDGDNYKLNVVNESSSDTLHDPDSFTNPTYAFDDDSDTAATKTSTTSSINASLGTTFTSRIINAVNIHMVHSVTVAGTSIYDDNLDIYLQTYDGATWSTIETLYSTGVYPTGSRTLTIKTQVPITTAIEGVRLRFEGPSYSAGGTVNQTLQFKKISYGYFDNAGEVVCDINTIDVDSNTASFALHWDGDFPTGTSGSFDLYDGTSTINLPVDTTIKKTGVVSKGALSTTTDLVIKQKLATTDTSATPSANGWSIVRF